MWRQVEYFACRKLIQNPFRKNFTPNRLFHTSRALFNHYKTLGVDKNADEKAIKQAFFKQAKKYHPDQNPDDPDSEKKFKEVNEAYQVLSDKNKRAEYDMFGTASNNGHPGAQGFGGQGFEGMNVQDIFENLFGMGMKQKREGGNFGVSNEPGNDIQMDISLSFEDAFKENKRDIRLSVEEKCGTCSGSGQKVGTSPTKCMHCNGSGMISRQTGFMIMQSSCPYCNGEGYSIDPCTSCEGSGLKFEQKTVAVTIPAGVEDGMRVRIPHQGSASRGNGARGHLYLMCGVKPSKKFERIKSDLHVQVVIPLSMALLGGSVDIPLPNGKTVSQKIAPGTQSGHKETMRGKGFPDPRTGMNGHLYVHINVHIPTGLDEDSKSLIEQFKEKELFRDPRLEKPNIDNERKAQGHERYGFRRF